jgi:SAM-dependent methyltransferase
MNIPDTYLLIDAVYIRSGQSSFNYSDGDAVEEYLAASIAAATDLATGSEELYLSVNDWPSLYHLSPLRANLLRPLTEKLKGKSVLEIGCGCGAITRFLGELGCNVVALEGSRRRAMITASRCRDLPNVTVICDNFQHIEFHETFDFVTLIGVLEYANLYIPEAEPHLKMLQKAREYINEDGNVLIAIENKLGLKYWAGAPEDHLGKPYIGIENKYTEQTPETFGKVELTNLLLKAGFETRDFLYPFPDYKVPNVILTDAAFEHPDFYPENLLIEKFDYFQNQFYQTTFSTTLVAQSLIKNRLLPDFSNSFFITASPRKFERIKERSVLAYTYSAARRKEFCKENLLVISQSGNIEVFRNYLYHDQASVQGIAINNNIANEKHSGGYLLYNSFIPIISKVGWSVKDVSDWAMIYFEVLIRRAYIREGKRWLPGCYVDLTPFNIIVNPDNSVSVFDQEWCAKEDLPLYYVFFRGLIYSIGRLSFYEQPADGTPLNIIKLTEAVVNTFIPFEEEQLAYCFKKEAFLFSEVILGEVNPFGFYDLLIRKNLEQENQALRNEVIEKQNEISSMYNQQEEFKESILRNIALVIEEKSKDQENRILQEQAELRQELLKMAEQSNKQAEAFANTLKMMESVNTELKGLNEKFKTENQQLMRRLEGAEHKIDSLQDQEKNFNEKENRLREEIRGLQKNLDWYRRTYEDRSFLGVIKEKIKKG